MIGRIRGELLEKQPPMVLVEACGVGYEVWVPMSSIYQLSDIGQEVILYTHFVVREDIQQLYGFATKSDRRLFQELIKVNGIGAKMALAILSGMDGSTLVKCIESQDHDLLCTVPGIGKKTAERIIIEIKDKINKLALELDALTTGNLNLNKKVNVQQSGVSNQTETMYQQSAIIHQALDALEALGYKRKEAEKYVHKVKSQADTVEALIRLALQATQK
ncbi:Holliday junction branch migration protein RuvA [Fastidiosibacter lacustris]|uniref:Holliday junction branch migration protein RuvA n=1 Tax=Fastidiosibacter lacustris TaxID=2056695 RepID=UPI000E34362D|nr:Holliday junction branch migration protein RuvA [Fastidiosibacter lacustris]